MPLTIFLAQVFGLYMIIAGIAIIANQRNIMLAVAALVEERFSQLLVGVLSLLLGLFLVNSHNDWSTLPAGIVSLIGWLSLVKGIFYLFTPENSLTKIIRKLNQRKWYMIDGIIAILIGAYLAGFGYGWF
ncbi:MAG TPA: hypothetical protein VEB18_01425 [Candidatus Paceibacterota bacterium]|nr:hypothetical protein [Candidatus Paceibacterota bacterium]